jgi:4-diphosphocytidyl-2C-methyl-D-erythritol kinase
VQQEQLLEVVSRIGADSISLLSIPERTKRAMLAEAVEDEIFSCTEQLIDLVNEQLDHDSSNINSSQSSLNQRQKKDIANKIIDLRERNQFLQAQYNDLVSGRSSSLLNTVNSVGVSTNQLDGLNSPTDNDGRPRNNDNDEANNTQFN